MHYRQIDMLYRTVNYCECVDKCNPTIVCIHGLSGNGFYSFGELVPFLKENFHLIIFDMPGHGKTNVFPEKEDYLFSNLACWLQEAINLILRKPFYIMGHSWGAVGAFTFPQNQP